MFIRFRVRTKRVNRDSAVNYFNLKKILKYLQFIQRSCADQYKTPLTGEDHSHPQMLVTHFTFCSVSQTAGNRGSLSATQAPFGPRNRGQFSLAWVVIESNRLVVNAIRKIDLMCVKLLQMRKHKDCSFDSSNYANRMLPFCYCFVLFLIFFNTSQNGNPNRLN